MKWQSIAFDWNQARAFLVTAEEGSLTAAARALNLTQPTLGRQVAALEAQLGVTLFERVGKSLQLTLAGLDLLDHFRAMGEAANMISLGASGQSQSIEGHVTISATNMMATHYLPPVLKQLRRDAPAIFIEVVTSNELSDLRRREADIAIRHARPEQPELIGKLISETTAHFYVSKNFQDRAPDQITPQNAADFEFIGPEYPERFLEYLETLGLQLTRDNLKITTASGTLTLELMKQGLGIGVLPREVAAMYPDLVQVMPELPPIPVPTWLVAHRELHTSRRVRLVFDLLAEVLKDARLR